MSIFRRFTHHSHNNTNNSQSTSNSTPTTAPAPTPAPTPVSSSSSNQSFSDDYEGSKKRSQTQWTDKSSQPILEVFAPPNQHYRPLTSFQPPPPTLVLPPLRSAPAMAPQPPPPQLSLPVTTSQTFAAPSVPKIIAPTQATAMSALPSPTRASRSSTQNSYSSNDRSETKQTFMNRTRTPERPTQTTETKSASASISASVPTATVPASTHRPLPTPSGLSSSSSSVSNSSVKNLTQSYTASLTNQRGGSQRALPSTPQNSRQSPEPTKLAPGSRASPSGSPAPPPRSSSNQAVRPAGSAVVSRPPAQSAQSRTHTPQAPPLPPSSQGAAPVSKHSVSPPAAAKKTTRALPAPPPIEPIICSKSDYLTGAVTKKYTFVEHLGSGGFAEVVAATEISSGKKFAVKVIDKAMVEQMSDGTASLSALQREIDIMKKLKHPNIIEFHEYIETSDKAYIIMELMEGGELLYQVDEKVAVATTHYTERDIRKFVIQIIRATAHLHSNKICHRDLKPENLMFKYKGDDCRDIKLIDFGLAIVFDKSELSDEMCGTPLFQAPEIVKREEYSYEVDLWAIGVITYILLCGSPPFFDKNRVRLATKISKGEYVFDENSWRNVSPEAKDLVKKLLCVDPKARLTAADALKHPWIRPTAELKARQQQTSVNHNQLHKFNFNRRVEAAENTFKKCQRFCVYNN